jgi:uncharacterized membrane protein
MQEHRIHQIFEVSVLLKGAHAATEAAGGLALGFTNNQWIRDAITQAARSELIEDKRDFIASHLLTLAQGFSIEAQHFYALYLLSHGIVKSALVAGFLMRKLWAYPTTMAVLGVFIIYQLYRYAETQSVGLLLLTLLDVVVVSLTWHEFALMRRHLPTD